jgi:hypothetical protein
MPGGDNLIRPVPAVHIVRIGSDLVIPALVVLAQSVWEG